MFYNDWKDIYYLIAKDLNIKFEVKNQLLF